MRPTFIIIAAAGFAALLTVTGQAQAQAPRTFVSGHGEDTNPCTLAAPCRTFAQALTQTNAGGEIAVLDTAGYGPVTIDKSVSIVNPGGVEAGISVPSAGTAITIEATSTITVALRGLTLEGAGVGQDGIKLESTGSPGGRLEIVDCVIRDFTHDGIYINPTDLNPPATIDFSITNTIVSDNGLNGIDIAPFGAATTRGVVDRVQASGNTSNGISVFGADTPSLVSVAISNSIADSNATGISVAAATAYLAKNTIAGNSTAFSVTNSGALFSFGDNDIKNNGNDGPTILLVAAK